MYVELILSQTVKSVKSLVSVSNSYYRYLLAEWIHRVGENTSGIRVGTMRTVTACYRLVVRRILPLETGAGSPAGTSKWLSRASGKTIRQALRVLNLGRYKLSDPCKLYITSCRWPWFDLSRSPKTDKMVSNEISVILYNFLFTISQGFWYQTEASRGGSRILERGGGGRPEPGPC